MAVIFRASAQVTEEQARFTHEIPCFAKQERAGGYGPPQFVA
ncbi:hypothetical protein [Acetobacter lambici]|nr:hypothetical protein [Acetobacter lambici]